MKQLERLISESKEWFENLLGTIREYAEYGESIVQTVREPLLVLDKELKVILANRAFYTTFQMTPEETENRLLFELGDRQWDIPELRELLEKILPQNTIFENFVVEHVFKTLGKRIMILNARRIYRFEQKTDKILLAIEDATERVQLRRALKESEEWLSITLKSIGDAVIATDRSGVIRLMNPVAESLTGWTESEAAGRPLKEVFTIISEETRQPAEDPVDRVIREGIVVGLANHTILLAKDGSELFIADSGAPIQDADGNILGVVLVFRDVTERRLAEKKLKESKEKLYEAYNQAEFYKDLIAHDMNNILQSISLGIELCEPNLGNSDKISELKTNLKIIHEQILRGNRLISNIKKFSQLDKTQITLRPMEISHILEHASSTIKNAFQERDINIRIDSIKKKQFILANELFEDVIDNILINAIQHNENPSVRITIKMSELQRSGVNYLKIEFQDNGKGIEDIKKKYVFQRGFTKDKSVHGMGFGLSLVKKLLELHNGDVWVEDRIEGDYTQGSNFIILVPRAGVM
ncbi:MAG: PAS domain S-box protein [Candidatus Helarchaeota archaeon]